VKVRTFLTATALCLLNISPALAFGLSGGGLTEMNRALYGTVLADLLVGDKMRIGKQYLCVSDELLMISAAALSEEQSEYQAEFIAEIVAGGEVAITIITAHMTKPDRRDAYFGQLSCKILGNTDLYPVKSVNGFETLDAYLKSDFVTKLPKP
jgi:hypothetical protein